MKLMADILNNKNKKYIPQRVNLILKSERGLIAKIQGTITFGRVKPDLGTSLEDGIKKNRKSGLHDATGYLKEARIFKIRICTHLHR